MIINAYKHYMKLVFLLFTIAVSFLSCKKTVYVDSAKCYDCEVLRMDMTRYHQNVCTNRIDTVNFQDANGNALQSICVPK